MGLKEGDIWSFTGMRSRILRLTLPIFVLIGAVIVFAISALYFESSVARAAGFATLTGAIIVLIGVGLFAYVFNPVGAVEGERASMSMTVAALIAMFAQVSAAFALDIVFGVAALCVYLFSSLVCAVLTEYQWHEHVGKNTPLPNWYFPGQVLNVGFFVFVFFPNIVGVASVILSILVYAPLADAEFFSEMKEKIPRKQKKNGVDRIA